MVASLVIFLIWFYKAYSNIYPQMLEPRYKKYWAIWSFFVPIVNFYLPYLMIKKMYLTISIVLGDAEAAESFKRLTAINILWALYILMWIASIVYFIVAYPNVSVIFDIVMYILIIPCIWLTVKIIQDYVKLEERVWGDK
jgi:hypothetical protein